MMKFKEESEDIAVKDRLWGATERELLGFAQKYADRHVVGAGRSGGQRDICSAAKGKGYRIGDVAKVGSALRRGADPSETLNKYRDHLGLSV